MQKSYLIIRQAGVCRLALICFLGSKPASTLAARASFICLWEIEDSDDCVYAVKTEQAAD